MKKLLEMMLMLFPTLVWGQTFYSAENISTGYGYSSSEFSSVIDATISAGGPRPSFSYGTDGSIYATTLINSNFMVLKFVGNTAIYLYGENGNEEKLFTEFDDIGYDYNFGFTAQEGFTGVLDFSKIVYNESSKTLWIPYTKGYSGYYMLQIGIINNPAEVSSMQSNDMPDTTVEYYNLQGMSVDKDTKGQVIIKKEGAKASKFINR